MTVEPATTRRFHGLFHCGRVTGRAPRPYNAAMTTFLLALMLVLALLAGWVLTVLGMPGNWLILAGAAAYAGLVGPDSRWAIGWGAVGVLLGLALVGELLEMVAGALGVARRGGSRRAAVLGLVGSLVGGFVGLFVGVPIPVVGSLVAAVVLSSLGALAGAVYGEVSSGRTLGESWEIGRAAFWGRMLGTLAKIVVACAMVGVTLVALVF